MVSFRLAVAFICFALACNSAFSQCSISNTRGNNSSFVNDEGYPFTTFYRNDENGSFTYDRGLSASIDTLRSRLSLILLQENGNLSIPEDTLSEVVANVYKSLHAIARKPNESYLIEGQVEPSYKRRQAFSFQIKAKGFVLLCAVNDTGGNIPTDTLQKLRDDIETMFSKIYYDYNYTYTNTQSHSMSKNLIHYLQAYDYLMTDALLNGGQTRVEEITCIGANLQKLVGEYFRSVNKLPPVGALQRDNDNHTLMAASVLGLASLVLHQHGANRLRPHRHPEKWARTAMWRIDKTIWDENGRAESKRGGTYGFAEGPYYFKYAYENLTPYFMALKNADERENLNKSVKPFKWIGTNTSTTIEKNFVDDPDFDHLFQWANDIQMPNGAYPTFDDTWKNTKFIGLAGFRNHDWCSNTNLPFATNGSSGHIDLREEFVAAAVDGFFGEMYQKRANAYEKEMLFDNNSAVIRSTGSLVNSADMKYLFINGENRPSDGSYHRVWGHDHNDIGSFILGAGDYQLIIDPGKHSDDKIKHIRQGEHHSTILLDDDKCLDEDIGELVNTKYLGDENYVLEGLEFKSNSNITVDRNFIIKDYKDYVYVIKDNIYYNGNSSDPSLANKKFTIYINGNGLKGTFIAKDAYSKYDFDNLEWVNFPAVTITDSTFSLDSNTATWSGACSDPNAYGLRAYFFAVLEDSTHFKIDSTTYGEKHEGNLNFVDWHTRARVTIDNSEYVRFRTVIHSYKCYEGPQGVELLDSNYLWGVISQKRQIGQEKCANLYSYKDSFLSARFPSGNSGDTVNFDGDEVEFCFEF
ncbi:MAG: hypothetical protein KDC92_09710, partial [Bacteroidetes bacterium]|nr:hypothetical protein [Bacteroidota bacterium]